jgi:protein phosphatase
MTHPEVKGSSVTPLVLESAGDDGVDGVLGSGTERTVNSDGSSETESSFSFYCWAASDVGRVRNNNEDAFLTSGQLDGEADTAWEGRLDVRPWALVADGMGGHAAGEVASALAVECLSDVLSGLETVDKVSAAIEATNLALHDAM